MKSIIPGSSLNLRSGLEAGFSYPCMQPKVSLSCQTRTRCPRAIQRHWAAPITPTEHYERNANARRVVSVVFCPPSDGRGGPAPATMESRPTGGHQGTLETSIRLAASTPIVTFLRAIWLHIGPANGVRSTTRILAPILTANPVTEDIRTARCSEIRPVVTGCCSCPSLKIAYS